ncbi:MAG: class I SAM-dependent methyltransferase [Deltaproteobacteria bacterium]|nr:class I SAM-dependent methyltransferase [Deltaproteobacteria bacterium]MBN2686878.1 class I SAM-dependent methyltransferase [Deltaproteobacteria bacterium]
MMIDHIKRWLHWGDYDAQLSVVPRLLRAYLLWNNDWYGSHAMRYLPIVRFIRRLPDPIAYPILEVGSGDRGIAPFLRRSVVTVDLNFDPENMKRVGAMKVPVRGEIEHLPFLNDSFDMAIAVDILEHLPENQRETSIKELFRVARKYVAVAVPCGGKAVRVEGLLDRFHQIRFGVPNKWLVEHKKNILPAVDVLSELFKKQSCFSTMKIESNTHLILWFVLEALEIAAPSNYLRRIMTDWLVNLASRLRPRNAYRQIFYIGIKKYF